MFIPTTIPGLRFISILAILFIIVWIALEGGLHQTIFLALFLSIIAVIHLVKRLFAGKMISKGRWLLVCVGGGISIGLATGLLTLLLMALKTGLHGHGPEITSNEITWLMNQIPFWIVTGLFAGLGLGLLSIEISRNKEI